MKYTFYAIVILAILLIGCGEGEQQVYQKAIKSGNYNDYSAYLEKFPDGTYVIEIRNKLEEMKEKMKYIVTERNWEFLAQDYNRDYGELHQIFKSQNQNIGMTGSDTEVKWAWGKVEKFWSLPIKISHFEQVNALGCWTREVGRSGEGTALNELLPMYARGIMQKEVIESTTEDAKLLKLTLLDWIVDMSYYADFGEFLRFLQENEQNTGILTAVDEVLVKVKTLY